LIGGVRVTPLLSNMSEASTSHIAAFTRGSVSDHAAGRAQGRRDHVILHSCELLGALPSRTTHYKRAAEPCWHLVGCIYRLRHEREEYALTSEGEEHGAAVSQ
jgi:hypothetical protein